jgi:hypothetical protein
MRKVWMIVALATACSSSRNSGQTTARDPAELYDSVTIDAQGQLAVLKPNGETIIVRKEGEQTAFATPLVSAARNAVAAQAMFRNCCTSYDVPLQLVVYSSGKAHRFTGDGSPIFQWAFADSGTRIAYGQEPVHFACATHYELRDIESGRLVDSVDVPQSCGQRPDPQPVMIPDWVAKLISRK